MSRWKPFKRVKNFGKSKVGKFAGRLVRSGVNRATGGLVDLGSRGKSNPSQRQVDNLLNQVQAIVDAPATAKANQQQIASLQANISSMSLPWYLKIKMWFQIKWATARGVVIGLIAGVILVLAFSMGWLKLPRKFGAW